jgi:hypothetical protein
MPALAAVRIDPASMQRVEQAIADFGRQGRFAFALTINEVVLRAQASIRAAIRGSLTVRSPATLKFLEQRVRIPKDGYAKVSSKGDRLTASLYIADPESYLGRGRLTLLATLATKTGGEKVQGIRGPLAVPTRALRPSRTTLIPRSMYPGALGLGKQRTIEGPVAFRSYTAKRTRGKARVRKGDRIGLFRTSKGRWALRGKLRTFAIDPRYHPNAKSFGVFQRTGPNRGDIRKLWKYVPRVPVPPRIPAQRILDAIVSRNFSDWFEKHLHHALRTAR